KRKSEEDEENVQDTKGEALEHVSKKAKIEDEKVVLKLRVWLPIVADDVVRKTIDDVGGANSRHLETKITLFSLWIQLWAQIARPVIIYAQAICWLPPDDTVITVATPQFSAAKCHHAFRMNCPRTSNQERAKWRTECREKLANHIHSQLGLTILPTDVNASLSTSNRCIAVFSLPLHSPAPDAIPNCSWHVIVFDEWANPPTNTNSSN
ncbi:hypothetical protein O988_06649, partial [Pseudogymnoascus sp. VKM F-3808]